MIISALNGGLGNQMFQCAIAMSLAEKSGEEYRIDTRRVDSGNVHHGILIHTVFRLPEIVANKNQIRDVLGWRSLPLIQDKLTHRSLKSLRGEVFFYEENLFFDEQALAIKKKRYLHGYWQSEKYFSSRFFLKYPDSI